MKESRYLRIGLVALAGLVVIALIPLYLVMSDAVQSSSLTCERCHPEPYSSWKASGEHPPAVSCSQCHAGAPHAKSIPPGFLADNKQVDPHCLSCHEEVRQLVDVKRKLIRVSHRRHFDEGLGCLDCHRYVAHGEGHLPQTNRPPKKACYPCHVLQIDGSAEDSSCRMCHLIILTTPPLPTLVGRTVASVPPVQGK